MVSWLKLNWFKVLSMAVVFLWAIGLYLLEITVIPIGWAVVFSAILLIGGACMVTALRCPRCQKNTWPIPVICYLLLVCHCGTVLAYPRYRRKEADQSTN